MYQYITHNPYHSTKRQLFNKAGKKLAISFYSMEINSAINYLLFCKNLRMHLAVLYQRNGYFDKLCLKLVLLTVTWYLFMFLKIDWKKKNMINKSKEKHVYKYKSLAMTQPIESKVRPVKILAETQDPTSKNTDKTYSEDGQFLYQNCVYLGP